MHYPRFKECLVLLVVFHLGSFSSPHERSSKMNPWHSGPGIQQHPPELQQRSMYTPCAYEAFDSTTPPPDYNED